MPFLITGLAFGTATSALTVVKRHYPVVIGVGGLVLIGMGVLIWTGEFTQLNITVNHWLQSSGSRTSTPTRDRAPSTLPRSRRRRSAVLDLALIGERRSRCVSPISQLRVTRLDLGVPNVVGCAARAIRVP